MSFLLHDSPGDIEMTGFTESVGIAEARGVAARQTAPTIIDEQLRVPEVGHILSRGRLVDLLDRSTGQFAATLISGRAGTGKTTLAADYARLRENVLWYSVGSADTSWEVFSNYFFAGLCGRSARRPARLISIADERVDDTVAAEFLKRCLGRVAARSKGLPVLFVLDDIHHIFDAVWFNGFFQQLILSLTPGVHLLMTCRSNPPAPLWRLRSKQMLNVIDERMLDFGPGEVRELCSQRGVPEASADLISMRSTGRIARIVERIDARRNLA